MAKPNDGYGISSEDNFKEKRSDVIDMFNNIERGVVSTIVSYFCDTSISGGPWEKLFETLYSAKLPFSVKLHFLKKIPITKKYVGLINKLRKFSEIRNMIVHSLRHMGKTELYLIGRKKIDFYEEYNKFNKLFEELWDILGEIAVEQEHKGKMISYDSWIK